MQETYLHLLWRQMRLPFHLLKLTNGKDFKLIHPGTFNRIESGPDFTDARIEIDGIAWAGCVEIHVRSSDWYRHCHHTDPAYNTVVLHVVYEHDKEIVAGGMQLPTLELKEFIDWDHFRKFIRFERSSLKLPCQSGWAGIERVFFRSMLERAFMERFERKYSVFFDGWNSSEPSRLFFFLLCSSFGLKCNAAPFEELASLVPFNVFKKMNKDDRFNMVVVLSGLEVSDEETVLLRNTAFLKRNSKHIKGIVSSASWKRKGMRPSSDPAKRIQQLARIASLIDFELIEQRTKCFELKQYMHEICCELNINFSNEGLPLTPFMFDQIMINALAPYLFIRGEILQDVDLVTQAIELLESLSAESNHITEYWRENGFRVSTALESQGLLELNKSYCQRKKCLNCTIGMKVLAK